MFTFFHNISRNSMFLFSYFSIWPQADGNLTLGKEFFLQIPQGIKWPFANAIKTRHPFYLLCLKAIVWKREWEDKKSLNDTQRRNGPFIYKRIPTYGQYHSQKMENSRKCKVRHYPDINIKLLMNAKNHIYVNYHVWFLTNLMQNELPVFISI